MLWSPLCHYVQDWRLLVVDLQPDYKSGANRSLPSWLSTAASILYCLASLDTTKIARWG